MSRSIALGLIALLLSACSASEPRGPKTMDRIHEAVKEEGPAAGEGRPAKPPAEISSALLPPIQLGVQAADAKAGEARFDVRVRGVPAKDFLLSMVEGTPYNVVISGDFNTRITLDLKNVTVPEVMEAVRISYGIEYDRAGNNFRILPNQLTTRLFRVNYLDIKRDGSSVMSASPGQVTAAQGNQRGGTSQQQSPTNPQGGVPTGGGATSISRVTTESVSEFWVNLAGSLQQLVGNEGGRSVSVNSQSGVILVRAYPSELREVGAFLETLEKVAQRQVILEARILEVELADGFQAGINWAQIARSGSDTATFGQFGGNTLISRGSSTLAGQTNPLNPSNPAGIRNTVTDPFGGMFALAIDTTNFTAFIELLKTQGDVRVLSSPRVSTVNNQKAVIKVGSDEFFVTGITSNTTTGTGTNQSVNVQITPFFSGVALDVTPQINDEGAVILHVHPSVSEVREQRKELTTITDPLGNTVPMVAPLAASTIRESDSIIRATDGQMVVLGGLMQTRDRDDEAQVPVLGDLPLIGNLFRHTKKTTRKSELVILLKPIVVDDGREWREQLQKSSQMFKELGEPM